MPKKKHIHKTSVTPLTLTTTFESKNYIFIY